MLPLSQRCEEGHCVPLVSHSPSSDGPVQKKAARDTVTESKRQRGDVAALPRG